MPSRDIRFRKSALCTSKLLWLAQPCVKEARMSTETKTRTIDAAAITEIETALDTLLVFLCERRGEE